MVNSDRVRRRLGATIVVQSASVGSQGPQPHLEDSSVYRPLRPTKLDKIKNLHAEIHTGAVDIPSWGGDVAFPN